LTDLINTEINVIDPINIQIITLLATSTPDSYAPPSGNLNLAWLKSVTVTSYINKYGGLEQLN